MNWLLLMLFSALVHSFAIILLKRDVMHEPNTQVIALYPLAGVIILPLVAPIQFDIIFTLAGWLLLLKTLFVSITIFANTRAMQHLPISIFAPLTNISPIFLLFTGAFFLGERIAGLQIVGLLILILSAAFLEVDIRKREVWKQIRSHMKNKAVLLVMIGSLALSFAPIMDRLALQRTDIFTALWFFLFFLSATFWILHIVTKRELPIQGLSGKEFLWLGLTGIVFFVSDMALFKAITIPGTILVVLIAIRRLSTLFVTIFGGRFFHEDHLLYKSGLCVLMILGIILLVL